MIFTVLICIAVGMFVAERLWPANQLPQVRGWIPRILLVNGIQGGIVYVAGVSWDRWLLGWSLVSLQDHGGTLFQAVVAYLVSTFVYYWWHRFRHESKLFWLLCHQLHHSPQRIEIFTSFYKHPVEITLNSILSALIVYTLLGCSVEAGVIYTVLTAVAEFFYHWNINTPYWLGYIFQRPESHRIHHKYRHHTQNFADLPVWDMLFGTFNNPSTKIDRCGYEDWREDRFEDMLAFRDLHKKGADQTTPLQFLPTCIGCSKRWACSENDRNVEPK